MTTLNEGTPGGPTALLPHQVGLVAAMRQAAPPIRLVLTGPPGSGKRTTLAAVAGMVCERSPDPTRVLVLTFAALTTYWAEQLAAQGCPSAVVMDGPMLRRIEAETEADQNPWSKHDCVVTSIDFVTRDHERAEAVLATAWDVVLVDEIHRCSGQSHRGRVARRVWDDTSVPLVAACTAVPKHPEWVYDDSATQAVHWDMAVLRSAGAAYTPPVRTISVCRYSFSPEEQAFDARLRELTQALPDSPVGGMLRNTLLRRWLSSPLAMEMSLRRLLGRVEARLEAVDELARLAAVAESELAEGDSTGDLDRLPEPLIAPEVCRELLDAIERLPRDSKWSASEPLLEAAMGDAEGLLVLFTDYADTAGYVAAIMEERPWRSVAVTGNVPHEQRRAAVSDVTSHGGCLITTTAAAMGLDVGSAKRVIHYDLPWNPLVLEQRLGWTERLPNLSEVQHHVLVPDEPHASVFLAILKKVTEIEMAFGIALETRES